MKNFKFLAVLSVLILSIGGPVFGSYIIPDSGVTTAKIATGAVTQAKLASRATGATVAAGGVAVSTTGTGNFNTSSGSNVDVTNATVTITTTGRPVFVGLIPDETQVGSHACSVMASNTSSTSAFALFTIVRGSTQISYHRVEVDGASATTITQNIPCGSIYTLDFPSAGTYTYKLQASGSPSTAFVQYSKLAAYEL